MSSTPLDTRPDTVAVVDDRTHRLTILNRWLLGAVALLLAGVAVLAVYAFVGFGDDPNQALVDDYIAAFNADDGNALRDLLTDGVVVMTPGGNLAEGIDNVLTAAAAAQHNGFLYTDIGDATTHGDYVAVTASQGIGVEHDVFLVFRVDDGQIAHLWMSRSP